MTIDGNGYNGYDGHRILNIVGSGTDVSLDNLTLTNGRVRSAGGDGAILLGGGSLAMTGCTVSDNASGRLGGSNSVGGAFMPPTAAA